MSRMCKQSLRRSARILVLAAFVSSSIVSPALAGPSGGRVVSGDGSISHNGNTSRIDQATDRLIIEWDSFDTTAQEQVRFNQPGSASWALNRVLSGHATMFDGSLFANGNVIIVNGAGIHFGPNARVDVGSLIASTAGISNSNFLNDRLIFDRPGLPDAMVSNEGMITVRDTGLAALVAPGVENAGLIRANLGTVILGAGEAHTIDFNGDGLVAFTITEPTKTAPKRRDGSTAEALVNNSGTVEADGGSIVMTASQASRVLDNAINMSGVAQANSVGMRNGKIVLFGGDKGRVKVSGRVHASGTRQGETGGTIHITGEEIPIPKSRIEALGEAGGGEVLIGGALKGGPLDGDSPIGYLKDGDLVSILTGEDAGAAGNGFMPMADRTVIGAETVIDASSGVGDGGNVIVWGMDAVYFHGTITTLGGDNGFVEVSTRGTGVIDGSVSTGHLLVDPGDVCILANINLTSGCSADATNVSFGIITDVLNVGGHFELNTNGFINAGTGRVDFGGGTRFDINNTSATVGTFEIHAADTINTQEAVILNIGTSGTNFEWYAGSSETGSPMTSADIVHGPQDLGTGGGYVIFDAADDVFIGDPLRTSGGDVTLIARGGESGSTITFGSPGPNDDLIDTTVGSMAGAVTIQTDELVVNSTADPVINANGTGGTVTFLRTTPGNVSVGDDNGGLVLSQAILRKIDAESLVIGSSGSDNRINDIFVDNADSTIGTISGLVQLNALANINSDVFFQGTNVFHALEARAWTDIRVSTGTTSTTGGDIRFEAGFRADNSGADVLIDTNVNTNGGSFSAQADDDVRIRAGATVSTNGGDAHITALAISGSSIFNIEDGSQLNTVNQAGAGGNVFIQADDIQFGSGTGERIAAADGTVVIARVTNGNVSLGDFNSGMSISQGELSVIDAAALIIGDASDGSIGDLAGHDNQIDNIFVDNADSTTGTITGRVQLNALAGADSDVFLDGTNRFNALEARARDDVSVRSGAISTTGGDIGFIAGFNTDSLGDADVLIDGAVDTEGGNFLAQADDDVVVRAEVDTGPDSGNGAAGNAELRALGVASTTAEVEVSGNGLVSTFFGIDGDILVVAEDLILGTGASRLRAGGDGGVDGDITILRSTTGSIGIGSGTDALASDMVISQDELNTIVTSGTVQTPSALTFGNPVALDSNTTDVNIGGVNFTAFGTVNINALAASTINFSGSNIVTSLNAVATEINVQTGATVRSDTTINFDAPTVNLDGDLIANFSGGPNGGPGGGITGTATTVNIVGSAGGAEIQDAVDVAAASATVNIGDGTFAGGVQVYKALTLIGDGPINTTVIDVLGNSAGLTVTSSNVTIDGLRFERDGDVDDTIGILLDGRFATNGAISDVLIGDTANDADAIGNYFADRLDVGIEALGDVDTVEISDNTFGIDGGAADIDNDPDRIKTGIRSRVERLGGSNKPNRIIDGNGIVIGSGQGPFSDWLITDNSFAIRSPNRGTAIDLEGPSGNVVDGFKITNNVISSAFAGMHIVGGGGSNSPHPISNNILIDNNTITGLASRGFGIRVGANLDRLSANNDRSRMANINISRNTINNTDIGIDVSGVTKMTMADIVVDGNTVNNADEVGIRFLIDGRLRSGDPNWTGFVISNNDVNLGVNGIGLLIDIRLNSSLAIGTGNSFDGGVHGILIDGQSRRTLTLIGNTLNDTVFTNQSGNYIELKDTALFGPGNPTVIDATGVTFDSLDQTVVADAIAIEDKIVHFLDADFLGLIDLGQLVVGNGGSIQRAVNAAGLFTGPQTITVGSGTYGGNIEVWVDDLTIVGADTGGGNPIIDLANGGNAGLDPFSNNPNTSRHGFLVGDFDVIGDGTLSAGASDSAANGNDVSGVNIDPFTITGLGFGNLSFGVILGLNEVLGVTPASVAIDTVIDGNTFSDVNIGIIANNIDGATILRDNDITSLNDGIQIAQALDADFVNILGNIIDAGGNAINFVGAIGGASIVDINDNELLADLHGIDLDGIATTESVVLRGNAIEADLNGINIGGTIEDSDVAIIGETITAGQNGIRIGGVVEGATMWMADAIVDASDGDGVLFAGDITDSTIGLGVAAFAYAFESNAGAFAGADAVVAGNSIIGDGAGAGDGNGVQFESGITGSDIFIVGNTLIEGKAGDGVRFDQSITDSAIVVAGNNAGIFGRAGDGIHFGGAIDNADIDIGPATVFAVRIGKPSVRTSVQGHRMIGDSAPGDFAAAAGFATSDPEKDTAFAAAATNNGSARVSTSGVGGSAAVAIGGDPSASASADTGTPEIDLEINAQASDANIEQEHDTAAAGAILAASFGGNVIEGTGDGIELAGAIGNGSDVIIAGNQSIEGLGTFLDEDQLGDGIAFRGAVSGATTGILIDDNRLIRGFDRGVNFASSGTGGPATITDASVVISGNDEVRGVDVDGILFNAAITGANITIGGSDPADGNGLIVGADDGIDIESIDGGVFTIAGNTTIRGENLNAIEFEGAVNNGAEVTVLGNAAILGNRNGINIGAISDSTFTIANNTIIRADSAALLFQRAITNRAVLTVLGNGTIQGAASGVAFEGTIANSAVVIGNNTEIRGVSADGIAFAQAAESSTIAIAGNAGIFSDGLDAIFFDDGVIDSDVTIGAVTMAVNGQSISFGGNRQIIGAEDGIAAAGGLMGDTEFTITDNVIGSAGSRIGENGIRIDGVLDTATVTIDANQVFAAQRAIRINFLQSPSTVSIIGGTYDGTGGALLVDNTGIPGPDGRLNLGAAAYIAGAGSTVFEVLTDVGNAGVAVDFNGAASFTGGATGMRLTGPGVSIVGKSLGAIAFNGQTGNFIELTDGALFEPGRPTIINGHDATYDGVSIPLGASAPLLSWVESRIVDFDDNSTLGQIFFLPSPPVDGLPEFGVRSTNVQAPGDRILRPEYAFEILANGILEQRYGLGQCVVIVDGGSPEGRVVCVAPASGSDISPWLDRYLSTLDL